MAASVQIVKLKNFITPRTSPPRRIGKCIQGARRRLVFLQDSAIPGASKKRPPIAALLRGPSPVVHIPGAKGQAPLGHGDFWLVFVGLHPFILY
jgi:hypothetical protein